MNIHRSIDMIFNMCTYDISAYIECPYSYPV